MTPLTFRALALTALAACVGLHAGTARASGCADGSPTYTAYYEIDRKDGLTVSPAAAFGEKLHSAQSIGSGNVLATCKGDIRYEGLWLPPVSNEMMTVMVGGKPAGIGMKVYITPNKDNIKRYFPNVYTHTVSYVDPIRTSDSIVGYELYRTSGPIEYGNVDSSNIVEQYATDENGNKFKVRLVHIKQLTLVKPTCALVVEDLNQTVTLPTASVSNFAVPEHATPWVPFSMRMRDCPDPTALTYQFTFGTAGDADSTLPELFSMPANGPKNVGLELADVNKSTIKPGALYEVPAVGSGEQFQFHVRMRQTRQPVQPGSFTRPIIVMTDYR